MGREARYAIDAFVVAFDAKDGGRVQGGGLWPTNGPEIAFVLLGPSHLMLSGFDRWRRSGRSSKLTRVSARSIGPSGPEERRYPGARHPPG